MEGEKSFSQSKDAPEGNKKTKIVELVCPGCGRKTGEMEVSETADTGHEAHHKTCRECANKLREQMGLPPKEEE